LIIRPYVRVRCARDEREPGSGTEVVVESGAGFGRVRTRGEHGANDYSPLRGVLSGVIGDWLLGRFGFGVCQR